VESVRATDGTTIAYTEAGDGPPLVLVHGITESHRAWDPILPALAERWHVVALDLRGHGDSDRHDPYDPITLAGDVAAVVAAAGVPDPLVVGHSLGGVVVSAYGGAGHPACAIVNVDQPIALGGFKESLEVLEPMLRGSPEEFATAVGIVFSALDGPLPASERARLDSISSPEQDVVLGGWGTVFDSSA
jgi:pimeloyl-ACP methyl ester carboxylesterase